MEYLARLGVERDTIVIAQRIPRELLADTAFIVAFDEAIAYGKAWLEVDMLEAQRSLVRDGKVSANLARLRHFKQWGQRAETGDPKKADQQRAVADVVAIIGKLPGRK